MAYRRVSLTLWTIKPAGTIYHEHVSYWALGPMIYLFSKYGMQVVNVERLPLHHGQLRVFMQR